MCSNHVSAPFCSQVHCGPAVLLFHLVLCFLFWKLETNLTAKRSVGSARLKKVFSETNDSNKTETSRRFGKISDWE